MQSRKKITALVFSGQVSFRAIAEGLPHPGFPSPASSLSLAHDTSGFATGFRNTTMPYLIPSYTDSIYLRLRERNLCNHRDYQGLQCVSRFRHLMIHKFPFKIPSLCPSACRAGHVGRQAKNAKQSLGTVMPIPYDSQPPHFRTSRGTAPIATRRRATS